MIGFGTDYTMNKTYEGLKDNDKLVELLSQRSKKTTQSITKELAPVNDYTGTLQRKRKTAAPSAVPGDRYTKQRSATANSFSARKAFGGDRHSEVQALASERVSRA